MIPLKDNLSCKVFPWVTLLLLALNGIGFAIERTVPASQLVHVFGAWMVTPQQFTHAFATGDIGGMIMGLVTMVTASFMHEGWEHIIGNMIFLQAFARSTEARMGSLNFAVFYLLACFAAWGMYVFSGPNSMIHGLGASGAMSAVLTAYLVFYPRAEFKSLIMITGWPLWAIIPAWSFVGVWVAQQFTAGWLSALDPSQADGIAVWAHIGGAIFGLISCGAFALFTADNAICYVPISCGHKCDNDSCDKKHHMQRFRFVRPPQWIMSQLKRFRLPVPPHKTPCEDQSHDHDDHN
jgi:membrane associated rhomboid family serine protease